MIKKGIFAIFTVLIFSFTPISVSAQINENEYRTYLLTIIELLQKQIILLQAERAQVTGTLGVPDIADFESFLINKEDVVAWYTISSPELSRILPDRTHIQYFSRFFEIVPNEYDKYFIDLLVFDESLSEPDGLVETVLPYRADTWRVGLNESIFEFSFDSDTVTELFVHEFAHLISYHGLPGTTEPKNNKCHEWFSNLGCPPDNSYLIDFMNEFWTEDDLDALVEFEGESIWINHDIEKYFVTEYASTNPAEDFAESFTFFVLNSKPSGQTLPDQKIKYFYQFDHLIDLREEIRAEL